MVSDKFIHQFLTKKLADKCGLFNSVISREECVKTLVWSRLDSHTVKNILVELESLGYIETVNKRNVKVNKEMIKDFETDWF